MGLIYILVENPKEAGNMSVDEITAYVEDAFEEDGFNGLKAADDTWPCDLLEAMRSYGMDIGMSDGISYFELSEYGRRNYFTPMLNGLKHYIADMDLEFFMGASAVSEICCMADKGCDGDFVFAPDGFFRSFDHFMRTAAPGRYYIGDTFVIY